MRPAERVAIIRQRSGLRAACAALFLLLGCTGPAQTPEQLSGPWRLESSGTIAGLRGIHAVSASVAWASGTSGTILRTRDAGHRWLPCVIPPGAEKLDFRGIWAWDAAAAIALSSGPGDQSRLYKTTDGCSHWTLLFTNPEKAGFWDALVFSSRSKGYLLGDPVNGRFAFYTTEDGGTTWKQSQAPGLAADSGAGAFAASNSALLGAERQPVLFGTSGALIYRQSFAGTLDLRPASGTPLAMAEQWSRSPIPLAHEGPAAGVFSIGWRDGATPGHGYSLVAVGGDYTRPGNPAGTAAWTSDGGRHWTSAATPPHGYRSAVAWDAPAQAWIAAGTNGSDISYDDGQTWAPLDHNDWNALSLPWVVGPHGRIAYLDAARLPPPLK